MSTDADALLRRVAADPAAAYALALALVSEIGQTGDTVIALRAAALAARDLGRLEEGLGHLRRALEIAERHGSDRAAAQVRMNLVDLLAAHGEVATALAEARRAEGVLRGRDADRLTANLACVLARAGRLAEAQEMAERALHRLRRGHDPVTLARLLTDLGLVRALRGVLCGAEAALSEAAGVAEAAGLGHQTALARSHLASVVSRRGDLPRALQLFAAAEPGLTGKGATQCRFDRAETLIAAGLHREAGELLSTALEEVRTHGYECDEADGLLLLAHAELAGGDAERAAGTAERARAAFVKQDRTGWVPLAEHLLLRARWSAGDRSAVFLSSASATADRLERGGWAAAAAEARVIAARIAMDLGRPAGHLLAPVSGARGTAAVRVAAWHATALERRDRHDLKGAIAAVWSGLRVVEEHTEVFGALELRARTAGLGAELAELGLQLTRSARELLTAEERRRAVARRPAAIRPPQCPDRAASFTELRTLSTEHAAATAQGRAVPGLAERLTRLETTIRTQSLRHPASSRDGDPLPGTPRLIAALEDRALLELIRIGPDLHAVTVSAGRPRRHHLGAYQDVTREVTLLRALLRRLAGADDQHADAALTETSARLEQLLLAPLRADLDGRELVIAPTGALHGLPWAALPALAGRPFTVTPSATAWLHARSRPAPTNPQRSVLIAGPDLTHAAREIRMLRRIHPSALTLHGARARAGAVCEALNGADLVHVAAHGEFRAGNALFSSLRLADGPLMVYDLEDLDAAPRLVVLSACDVGRADAGDAVIGMAGVLLALGTATVIASVTPVRDRAAPEFMAAFHTALAGGHSPARALATAPRSPGVAGYLCFGAG